MQFSFNNNLYWLVSKFPILLQLFVLIEYKNLSLTQLFICTFFVAKCNVIYSGNFIKLAILKQKKTKKDGIVQYIPQIYHNTQTQYHCNTAIFLFFATKENV